MKTAKNKLNNIDLFCIVTSQSPWFAKKMRDKKTFDKMINKSLIQLIAYMPVKIKTFRINGFLFVFFYISPETAAPHLNILALVNKLFHANHLFRYSRIRSTFDLFFFSVWNHAVKNSYKK